MSRNRDVDDRRGDRDWDRRERGRDPGGYRYNDYDQRPYNPNALYTSPHTPLSPQHDYDSRRPSYPQQRAGSRHRSRSRPPGPHDTRARSRDRADSGPRPRDPSRSRRPSPTPPALLGRLDPVSPRSGPRQSDSYPPPHSARSSNRVDHRDDYGNLPPKHKSPAAVQARVQMDGNHARRGDDGRTRDANGSSTNQHTSARSDNHPSRPPSPVPTPQALHEAIAGKKRPHADIEGSERRNRPPPIMSSMSDGHDAAPPTATTSGSATPAASGPTLSLRESSKAPSAAGPSSSTSGQKRGEARTKPGRSSSRSKATASGGEQEDKGRSSTRTGGSHSSKDKGKPMPYHPRVDPAVLQLVKANQALYNAEATVDKFRLETSELEKSLGMPVKDLSPEDQQLLKGLVHEFGQHRDAAKRERDSIVIAFNRAVRPFLRGVMEELVPQISAKIESATTEPKVDENIVTSNGNVEKKAVVPSETESSATAPVEQQTGNADAEAEAHVDEPMPEHTLQQTDPTPVHPEALAKERTHEAEVAEGAADDAALHSSDGPAAMDVDVDGDKSEVPAPIHDSAILEQPASTHDSATAELPVAIPPFEDLAAPTNQETVPLLRDEILPGNKEEKRKLVGHRLRKLENGLQTVTSTTDELARKLDKLEEQVSFQEEQFNEYLDSRSLETTGVPVTDTDGNVAKTITADEPSSSKPTETAVSLPPLSYPSPPSAVIDATAIDSLRAEAATMFDARLEKLAQVQDRRLAEIAQAQETRLAALGSEIRAEIQVEAARAEQAYASAIEAADQKAGTLEEQLASVRAELTQFKQERKIIEDIIKQQSAADQLIKTIRESTLKAQLTDQGFRNGINGRLGQIDDRLSGYDDRLSGYDDRLTEHNNRLTAHDAQLTEHAAQLSGMSSFENTKEAWRSDMIDMKNHVVGRVDYLEDQVESIKKPLVAARFATQVSEQSPAPPAQRTSSPAAQPPRPVQQTTSHRASPAAQQMSHGTSPVLQQPTSQSAQAQHNRPGTPTQSSRASPADSAQGRLTLNTRVNGPVGPSSGGTALNSAPSLSTAVPPPVPAVPNRSPLPGSGNGFLEYQSSTSGALPFPSTQAQGFTSSWPAQASSNATLSAQQQPVQNRLSGFGNANDRTMRQSLSSPMGSRPTANGSLPTGNATSDSALAGRLNTDARTQYQRAEPTSGPLLPLHMRMHNGTGLPAASWNQPGNLLAQPGATIADNRQTSPSTSEGALGGRLGARMYDPGEAKPQP